MNGANAEVHCGVRGCIDQSFAVHEFGKSLW